MKVSKQEMFDALTLYYKNDWRKTGQFRSEGIQVGNSKWYLIAQQNSNLIIYKNEDNYDLSKFGFDFQTSKGRGTQWTVHWNFSIGNINTAAKRNEFSEWEILMNSYKECA